MTERRLLEPHELAELGPPEAVRLPVDLVDPSPSNPRQGLAEVDALAESIKDPKVGLLQPILVRRMGERYEVLAGHRRRAAFLLLAEAEPVEPKWRTIPAVIRTAGDEDAYLMLLSSQLHSKQWSPREESTALEALAVEHTLAEIGRIIHRGESWVSKRLRVYADDTLSVYVQTGRLTVAVAEELLLVPDRAQRREFADQAVAESWTASQARAEVRKLKVSKQISQIGRLTRELVDLLSSVEPSKIPVDTTRDLWVLVGRVQTMARGAPVIPSIAEAEKAAGVNPAKPAKARRTRLKID